jgi:putative restriction endonuclease
MAMALDPTTQARLRLSAFAALETLIDSRGGFATYDELLNFELEGFRFPLIDANRGIRNPADFDATLSIVSSLDGPYDDHIGDDGILRYAHRQGDILGGDNKKLRVALDQKTPIILFEKPMKNVYVPILPAFVIDEDQGQRFFMIATGEAAWRAYEQPADDALQKRYVAQTVQRRVHQPVFRARVILAYSSSCTICRLNHVELLDAAHIIPDRDAEGSAQVSNGLALCKIHHSAFDNNLIGISADFTVSVNKDVLAETDGPMLKHGIQEMHGVKLTLPKRRGDWPSREALHRRYSEFHG